MCNVTTSKMTLVEPGQVTETKVHHPTQPCLGHTSAVARNAGNRCARHGVKPPFAFAAWRSQRSVQALRERCQQATAAALAARRRMHCLRGDE